MTETQIAAVREFRDRNIQQIDHLQQSLLLPERELIPFCRRRGIMVEGVLEGEPSAFLRRGWLERDGLNHDGGPLFHPFRLYAIHRILGAEIPSAGALPRERSFNEDVIGHGSPAWNAVVDLACILEPIYWPRITGNLTFHGTESSHRARLAAYQAEALRFIKDLGHEEWLKAHASIRMEAARLDDNPEIYLLLRLSTWEARSKATGRISAALWVRQMAEVIRRAFEEACDVQWLEEDQATGSWRPGGRQHAFGSERPLDDEFRSKPYLAYRFGLFTGSAVRWYMEGDTEYYAVDQLLPESHKVGIELVNLKGAIAEGKGNAAFKLTDMLAQDRALRRFSIISFDLDVKANERAIRQMAATDQIVGLIAANRPDFEFANFTVDELKEIAARIDESHGFSGVPLRQADWTGVDAGGKFEARYAQLSERRAGSLKGEEWGRALSAYANQNLRRPDGTERTLWNEISAAVYCWNSNYDYDVAHFKLDPKSFARMAR